jgi:hypothetical protein
VALQYQEEDGGMMHGRGIVINEDEENKGFVVDRRLEDSKTIKTRDFVWKTC